MVISRLHQHLLITIHGAKPFEAISKVKQIRVDTTLATAVLFILVFALMLGDIGLGVVLVLLGLL